MTSPFTENSGAIRPVMANGIGIDTGGTYTDAVLLDLASGSVLRYAKAPTRRHNLAQGVSEALGRLLAPAHSRIELVSLSTTLATNALVENQGAPVCLLLLGYGGVPQARAALAQALTGDRCVFLPGGHNIDGQEQSPLDISATQRAIIENAPHVRAFAVSGYFGTRNPSHEQIVCQMVHDLTGLPTTAGHELTLELDAIRRATTAALNARLIPLISDLIDSVERSLSEQAIDAPLMIVKGDGSLIKAQVARERPIETVLSGPAASVVGALHLARSSDAIVADMGGTTTDIALVRGGLPRLAVGGARVGPWHTMVEAIDMRTVGLGGDSEVHVLDEGRLGIGPRRVMPLCMLAAEHPAVEKALARLASDSRADLDSLSFVCLGRSVPSDGLPTAVQRALAALEREPLSLPDLNELLEYPGLHRQAMLSLERQGVLLRAGITPTDAAHALGLFNEWSIRASSLALGTAGRILGTTIDALAQKIISSTSARLAQELARQAWAEDVGDTRGAAELSDAAWEQMIAPLRPGRLRFRPQLVDPVIGLGAPATSYFPAAAELLGASVELPELASVANAVGAIVGSVVARSHATIVPAEGEQGFVARSVRGATIWPDLDTATAQARADAERDALQSALAAGAESPRVTVTEATSDAPVGGGYAGRVFVSMSIVAEAIGRPALGR